MAKLASVDFEILDATGANYLSWQLDIKLHMRSLGLGSTLVNVVATEADTAKAAVEKAKAIIYIRRHIDKTLKSEYLHVEDPYKLWMALEQRYKHQKDVILPRARFEWENLRLQDYKSIAEYNSALFNITSRLELCDEAVSETRMLEKTYTSFHEKDAILMQQYRERNFTKYSDLLACLLMAEQNRELLLVTHNMRPSGTAPLPESHKMTSNLPSSNGKGKSRRKRGGKKNATWKHNNNNYNNKFQKNNTWKRQSSFNRRDNNPPPPKREWEDRCQKCGKEGHWSKTCRTARHLQDLFQESTKKKAETNLVANEEEENSPERFTADDFANDDLLD